MMITGDLVKCNDTGSLGVVTRISEAHVGSLVSLDYRVLWPEGSSSWENAITVTPIPEKEYAV